MRDIVDVQIIGACRLAIQAAADHKTAIAVIERLLAQAQEQPDDDTESVKRFIDVAQDLGGEFVITDPETSIEAAA